ncbi:MAG TPA: hypothetical protein VLS93_14910 [Anaeromyxobacteraceae bacterium]|nr:hypothetical protein [Anaeromyxobacteraceae bacterium]
MADQPENKVVDKRVAVRYLRKGLLDEKDYERHLKSLPDLADDAMPVEASIEHAAPDEDDEADEPA